MQMPMSHDVLLELSNELQKKIDDLGVANYRCEKILRYLVLCQIENDDDQSKPEKIPLNSQNRGVSDQDPARCVLNRHLPTLSGEDKNTTVLLSNSLEDVLTLAKEIRERKIRNKSSTTAEICTAFQNVDSKLVSKFKAARTSSKNSVSVGRIGTGRIKVKTATGTHAKHCLQSLAQSLILRDASTTTHRNRESVLNVMPAACEEPNLPDRIRMLSIRENLFNQLDVLKRQKRRLHQLPIYDTYKELYSSQHQLLSVLNDRITFPRSVAFSALKFEQMERNNHSPQNSQENAPSIPDIDPRSKNAEDRIFQNKIVLETMKNNEESYNKLLKGKLSRIPVSKMSKEDIKEIFAAWYQTQRLLEAAECSLYGDESSTSGNGEARCETADCKNLQEMKTVLMDRIPVRTFSHIPLISDEILVSKNWLIETCDNVKNFHDSFDCRIKHLIETGIGRYELRSTVQQLKECCRSAKEMTTMDCDKRNNLNRKWIDALKYYKAVRTCLVSEAQDDSSCMFISHT